MTVAPNEINSVFEEIGEPPRISAQDIDKMLEPVTAASAQQLDEAV
ncbi:MAG: hypothetical protein P8Y36_00665 [Alphaproteobacteria bacterium]